MKEINFYCIEEDINSFLYNFLSGIINQNKRVMIFSENQEKMIKLDDTLWTMKKTGFLPHLLFSDNGADRTPIIISNNKKNINNSNFILISNFLDDVEFLNTFEKVFYIFSPINKALLQETKNSWNKYKQMNFETKIYKKNSNGKWSQNIEFLNDNSSI